MSNSEHHVEVLKPKELTEAMWGQIQVVSREAFSAVLLRKGDDNEDRRTQEDVDYWVRWRDFDRFHSTHLNPNAARGNGLYSAQRYYRPRVAVTLDGLDIVGFAYGAGNVSGNLIEQAVKMLNPNPFKRNFWVREIAVKPDYQRQGIAKALGRKLLESANPDQPVSAFVWPDEIPGVAEKLEEHGFYNKGEDKVSVFGERTRLVRQVMMKADKLSQVLATL